MDPLLVTFNGGRELAKPHVLARHLVQALPSIPSPEIIVLSLQEIAPIAYAFLGGSFLSTYLDRYNHAVDIAARSWSEGDDKRYINLATRNVGMTAVMVFVRADSIDRVRWVEAGGTGVGWYETGNKGCVGVRLGYEASGTETMELTFLSAHLAPMEDRLAKRNQDWKDVVQRLVFTPVDQKGQKGRRAGEEAPLLAGSDDRNVESGIYTSTSYLFIAGDLNYRTSTTKPRPEDYSTFPQPVDKANSQHYSNLFRHDQLLPEIEAGRTVHGFSEFPINFPPTYKYSDEACAAVGEREDDETYEGFDSQASNWGWALHRWPSWCDRILYLDLPPWMKAADPSSAINLNSYTALPLMSTSDHRPVALSLSLPLKAIPAPTEQDLNDLRLSPPFDIDPSWRSRRAEARRKEIALGLFSYLSLTWEGNGIVLATVLGAVGGWAVIRSMVME